MEIRLIIRAKLKIKDRSMQGIWLSLLDYVRVTRSSISTARRRIKGNKVPFKKRDGKYFLFVDQDSYDAFQIEAQKHELTKEFESHRLKVELKKINQENEELKMLLKIYEDQLSVTNKNINQTDNYEIPNLPL